MDISVQFAKAVNSCNDVAIQGKQTKKVSIYIYLLEMEIINYLPPLIKTLSISLQK